jgi:aminomethyltransferase
LHKSAIYYKQQIPEVFCLFEDSVEGKKTGLYDIHVRLSAQIVSFGGYLMPLKYTSIMEEHRRVRQSVGVFDVSHMGEFTVSGAGALEFVNRFTTNDVASLGLCQVQYSAMLYDHGGIVDDLLVYRMPDRPGASDARFMLVVNAANLDKDFQWIHDHCPSGVELKDISDEITLLAVQGPDSLKVVKKLTSLNLDEIKYYWCAEGTIAGVPGIISRTGYTGEVGWELYVDRKYSETLWNAVMAAGKEFGIGPVGLGARDTLRLEMKYCLYGNDITKDTNPLEAGLGWITKLGKGDFIGRDALLKAKEAGLSRKLIGFELLEKAFPRPHYPILKDGKKVGEVTSGTMSPMLDKGIGLGYVPVELSKIGTEITVDIRGKHMLAVVAKTPFCKDTSLAKQ